MFGRQVERYSMAVVALAVVDMLVAHNSSQVDENRQECMARPVQFYLTVARVEVILFPGKAQDYMHPRKMAYLLAHQAAIGTEGGAVKRVPVMMIPSPGKGQVEKSVRHSGGSYLPQVEECCHMSYIAS